MDWLSTILSSGIIATVISCWAGEKGNRLKYITSERSKWRAEIKEIAGELSECQFYDERAKRLLTDLKLRINSYGKKDNYLSEIQLRVFEDEHIWKEISDIEKGEKYIEHRDKLLRYIELLLKFDWERSKSETKSEQKTLLLTIIFIGTIVSSVFVDYVLLKGKMVAGNVLTMLNEEVGLITIQGIILLLFLLPTFVNYINFSRVEETYNRWSMLFLSLMLGEILAVVCWIVLIFTKMQGIYFIFFYLEMFLGLAFFIQEVNKKRNYITYSNKVMENFTDAPIWIGTNTTMKQELFSTFFIEPKFNNNNISYRRIYNLNLLSKKEIETLKIRWLYNWKFMRMKKKNSKLSKKEFFEKYPKAYKIFIKRGNKIEITRKGNNWKKIIKEIIQIIHK